MDISYTLIRSDRRTISLQITPEGNVVVRCPKRMAKRDIDAFVHSKASWLKKHLENCRPQQPKLTWEEIHALAEQAMEDIPQRVSHFARIVGVSYGGITIRNQRTRWGSCSGKGNLNFNCLLMLCPPEVRDYVVVHELCHRKEMNHSTQFWTLVEQACPDYRSRRKWLKEQGNALIARLP